MYFQTDTIFLPGAPPPTSCLSACRTTSRQGSLLPSGPPPLLLSKQCRTVVLKCKSGPISTMVSTPHWRNHCTSDETHPPLHVLAPLPLHLGLGHCPPALQPPPESTPGFPPAWMLCAAPGTIPDLQKWPLPILLYSFLAVYGVAQSRTRLKRLNSSSSSFFCTSQTQVKSLPAMQETWVWSLSLEDPLVKNWQPL